MTAPNHNPARIAHAHAVRPTSGASYENMAEKREAQRKQKEKEEAAARGKS